MKDDIKQVINDKLVNIDTSIKEIYNDNASKIDNMVEAQNSYVDEQQKRNIYLAILKEASKSGKNITYNEEMTTEELENLAREIEVQ